MTDTNNIGLPAHYRAISEEGFEKVNPDEGVGPSIKMKWIPIDKLFVDTRYQREVAKGSKSNVRQIAKRFKWRRFAPVIVTPIIGTDCYSVIDGQHKATGALLRGLKEVPCGIVETASLEDQADSFKFLNANTTKIMQYDIFKASLAANDFEAVAINNLAKKCSVTFVSSKVFNKTLKVGECKTYKSFESESKKFDLDIFIPAVSGIAKNPTSRTVINGPLIGSMCQVLKSNPHMLKHSQRDVVLARLNFLSLYNRAVARFHLDGGTIKAALTALIYSEMTEKLNIQPQTMAI
jgi:hypothetical protein